MFTFKKIALLGVMGLAALSMSCSDDTTTGTPGGTIDGIDLGTPSNGVYPISATITADGDNNGVKSVTATATGGTVVEGNSVSGTPDEVNFLALGWKIVPNVCAAGVTTVSVTVTVRAEFETGDAVEESKTTSVACTTPLPSGFSATGNPVLGSSSNNSIGSFLDINKMAIYTATTAVAVKNEIDLVYDGTNFLTGKACETVSFCSAQTSKDNLAYLYNVTEYKNVIDVSTVDALMLMYASLPNLGNDEGNALPAVDGGYYFVEGDDFVALIRVNSKGANSISLSIGRVDDEN